MLRNCVRTASISEIVIVCKIWRWTPSMCICVFMCTVASMCSGCVYTVFLYVLMQQTEYQKDCVLSYHVYVLYLTPCVRCVRCVHLFHPSEMYIIGYNAKFWYGKKTAKKKEVAHKIKHAAASTAPWLQFWSCTFYVYLSTYSFQIIIWLPCILAVQRYTLYVRIRKINSIKLNWCCGNSVLNAAKKPVSFRRNAASKIEHKYNLILDVQRPSISQSLLCQPNFGRTHTFPKVRRVLFGTLTHACLLPKCSWNALPPLPTDIYRQRTARNSVYNRHKTNETIGIRYSFISINCSSWQIPLLI